MGGKVLATDGAASIFDALDRVNTAIEGATGSKEMLTAVLDSMLDLFGCDRAWLLYPCSSTAESFSIPMERTRPEWPGAAELDLQIPNSDQERALHQLCLDADGPVRFDPEQSPVPMDHPFLTAYQIKSQLVSAIFPVGDQPWMLGIHHCAEARVYREDLPLFRAVGRRIADGLSRHLALEQLRRSEERFRILVENAPESIVLIDTRDGRFVDVNRNAERLFGLSRERLLELGPLALSPEIQSDGQRSSAVLSTQLQAALGGQVPSFEWMFLDGKHRPLTCELRLIQLPGDPHVRGSITDIAARKLAEREREELRAQLVQAQKMEALGQLTGGIAHDFNNLLTVIIGNLELLANRPECSEPILAAARNIEDAAGRARALTHRLLAFARKQPLRPAVFDAGALLRGMDEMLRRTLGESVALEIVVSGGLWSCEADATQLENAILNLAINARDAMPLGGRLTIEASNARLDHDYAREHSEVVAGQYVLFAVTDSGTGIPSDVLESVFTPFFTTKPAGRGSGLGLSMVHGFVKQSGGHIKIYSEGGHGTTVKLYLPRGMGAVPSVAVREGELPVPGEGETILLVEDDAMVRSVVAEQLEQLGYRVVSSANGDAALELLRDHLGVIRLLLTDVILSDGMKGTELASRAAEMSPRLPVVFMSGYTENAIIHNGRIDPGVELLEKPFDRGALARTVHRALSGNREG